ncbi:MAG: helix-turn-helix domain-containing protein [Bifidobacterium choerinum]
MKTTGKGLQACGEDDVWLTPDDVARMMRVTRRTVSTWRYRGTGPRYVHITHNCVRYRMSDVRKWIESKAQREGGVA